MASSLPDVSLKLNLPNNKPLLALETPARLSLLIDKLPIKLVAEINLKSVPVKGHPELPPEAETSVGVRLEAMSTL